MKRSGFVSLVFDLGLPDRMERAFGSIQPVQLGSSYGQSPRLSGSETSRLGITADHHQQTTTLSRSNVQVNAIRPQIHKLMAVPVSAAKIRILVLPALLEPTDGGR